MGSHEPESIQSHSDRQRSRSPLDPSLRTTAEPALHEERRARWRSPDGVQGAPNNEATEEKRITEEERRHNFREGKGSELLYELEVNDRMVFLLQETPKNHRGRARCRADDCVYVQAENPNGRYITDDYRICVDKGRSYGGMRYYHVPCIECITDLRELIPSKFKMAGSSWRWGLMIKKWFEHKGSIALDKIAVFLEERDAFNKERREFDMAYITWSNNHEQCEAVLGTCSCPALPKRPDTPMLNDYTTKEEEGCNLSDVLDYPRVEDPLEEFLSIHSLTEDGEQ